jgi:hypothetical protein
MATSEIDDPTEEGSPPAESKDRRVITQPFDFSVRTLVDSIRDRSLTVQDVYQRNFVWDKKRSSKLVESIFLNIPIPVCYFAEDDQGGQTVVDGHQRLRSINEFYLGQLQLRGLEQIPTLNGKTFTDLQPRDQRIFLTKTIRCIVIMKESDPTIRFNVFERLNTGAVPLNAQEVRNCVYAGTLNNLLRDYVQTPQSLQAFHQSERADRMGDCELLLRFLALDNRIDHYSPSMKTFLNNFIESNRNPSTPELARFRQRLDLSLKKVSDVFGDDSFRLWTGARFEPNINRAIFDAVTLCLVDLPNETLLRQRDEIRQRFKDLCLTTGEMSFGDAVAKATGDRARLTRRIRLFADQLTDLGNTIDIAARLPKMASSG